MKFIEIWILKELLYYILNHVLQIIFTEMAYTDLGEWFLVGEAVFGANWR